MAKGKNRLSARAVQTLKEPGLHADGDGLYLCIKKGGSKNWTFIYRYGGKRREKGFGSLSVVALADARTKRDAARELLESGFDPALPPPAKGESCTFGQAALALIADLEKGWKNAKHKQQWRNTLTEYCEPIWHRDVASIDTPDVVSILRPIWKRIPETSTRLRGRIERVLDAARVNGQREGENPARWKGHLQVVLGPARKKSDVRHHPAMPYKDIPQFMKQLRQRRSMGARCLEFLIYIAARTNEVLNLTWKEIDFKKKLWIVPADRMKAGLEHRVPLTEPAMNTLRICAAQQQSYGQAGKAQS